MTAAKISDNIYVLKYLLFNSSSVGNCINLSLNKYNAELGLFFSKCRKINKQLITFIFLKEEWQDFKGCDSIIYSIA